MMLSLLFVIFLLIPSCISKKFGAEGQKAVLDFHNEMRSQLANGLFKKADKSLKPPATNMEKMVWNETLTESAEAYANTFPKSHSNDTMIGENLYWHWSSKPGEIDKYGKLAAISWIEEFQKIDWNSNILSEELFATGIGHATQFVWSDTTQLGCAFSTTTDKLPQYAKELVKITVVCHYSPKGNYLNESIYDEGETCSKCSTIHRTCERPSGLCV